MGIAKAMFIILCPLVLVPFLRAQTISVTGIVKDGNGATIGGARISALDDQDHTLGSLVITGPDGRYRTNLTPAAVSIACQILIIPTLNATTYANNPNKRRLQLSGNSLTVDFTFYQITTVAPYWRDVARQVDVKATKGQRNSVLVTAEWRSIAQSGLPPDSKAVAAHQFHIMNWSNEINGLNFSDYANVDVVALSKALNGDRTALVTLPKSIATDVVASSGATR